VTGRLGQSQEMSNEDKVDDGGGVE
jgi:hypothetical protein